MMHLTGEEKEIIKINSITSSTSNLNGFLVKGNLTSVCGNKRQSYLNNADGSLTKLDKNSCKSQLNDPISGHQLHHKMSFSSISDVNQQLFYNKSASSFSSSSYNDVKAHHHSIQAAETLNGHIPSSNPITSADKLEDINNHQPCDNHSNNHNNSVLFPNNSKFACASANSSVLPPAYPSASLKAFSSQINSTLRRSSDYVGNLQHQYNHQQKEQQQQLISDQQSHQQHQQQQLQVWYCVQFRRLCQLCLITPLIGLLGCLCIACIFQFGEIQETACKVIEYVHVCSNIK